MIPITRWSKATPGIRWSRNLRRRSRFSGLKGQAERSGIVRWHLSWKIGLRAYFGGMAVPKEIRHTVGNLRNMVRSAKEAKGLVDVDLFDDRLDEIVGQTKDLFLQWVKARFGLCVAEMMDESDGIIDLARRLQDAPQTQAPTLRRVLKQGPPGAPKNHTESYGWMPLAPVGQLRR